MYYIEFSLVLHKYMTNFSRWLKGFNLKVMKETRSWRKKNSAALKGVCPQIGFLLRFCTACLHNGLKHFLKEHRYFHEIVSDKILLK